MTISDEDLKELKSCIYHDLAEMLRRVRDDEHPMVSLIYEAHAWALYGGDPDLEEDA